jgi:hypothetical protein
MTKKEEGFAARWSRLKRRDPDAGLRDETKRPRTSAPEMRPEPETSERDDAEILAELGLKDPDLLEKGDDFAAFLRAAVPERLRRRALRRLWRSNPVLANLDGLNDYDTDFVRRGASTGVLKTAYEVGSGFARKQTETDQDGAACPAERAVTEPAEGDATEDEPAGADDDTAQDCTAYVERQDPGMNGENSQVSAADPVRRRMRFRFDG